MGVELLYFPIENGVDYTRMQRNNEYDDINMKQFKGSSQTTCNLLSTEHFF